MKVNHSISTSSAWLLLLAGGIQTRYGSAGVEAFVPPPTSAIQVVTTNNVEYFSALFGAKGQDEEAQDEDQSNNPGVDRRGTLMTLFGTAASFAVGDVVLNAAVKATGAAGTAVMATAGGSGLYERVLAFGNKYRGAAIASEELTTWIVTQSNVAATPEIRAWLAAQRKLQMVRKTSMAATAAVTRAKTTKRAAATVGGGGILEEGFLAAAAATAASIKAVFSAGDDYRSGGDTTSTTLEASSAEEERTCETLTPSTCSKGSSLAKKTVAPKSTITHPLSASATGTDGNDKRENTA